MEDIQSIHKVTFNPGVEAIEMLVISSYSEKEIKKSLKNAISSLDFKGSTLKNALSEKDELFNFVISLYSGQRLSVVDTRTGKLSKEEEANMCVEKSAEIAIPLLNQHRKYTILENFELFQTSIKNIDEKKRFVLKHEETLVQTLKYATAWEAFLQWCLEESRFYSLELILESAKEIECSMLLASKFFYKESLQVLRNFLEMLVAQFYFSINQNEFLDWRKKSKFKMPKFTWKNGMTDFLLKHRKINKTQKKQLDKLYSDLSAYTHSKVDKLICRDVLKGKDIDIHGFNEDYFLEWCSLFNRVIKTTMPIFSKHVIDWFIYSKGKGTFLCDSCRNDKFKKRIGFVGKTKVEIYSCKYCGREIIKNVLDI